jgi:hypothetical protein
MALQEDMETVLEDSTPGAWETVPLQVSETSTHGPYWRSEET